MSAGNNEGNQLNLFLFELVMIVRLGYGATATEKVLPVAIHPLVVVPNSVRYTDNSRSVVQETVGGAVLTVGGRQARTVAFQGVFGVESRFLGIWGGTGDLRFKRFWHEIVRLADATNKDQVKAEEDPFRSPFLSLLLKPYLPDQTSFAVNFYDFWHNCKMQVTIPSFTFSKAARGGAASGNTAYTLTVKEVGPIVTGAISTTLINALFEVLTTWTSINDIIKSYTLEALAQGFSNLAGLVTSRIADSINAVNAQIDGVIGLLNGGVTGPTSSIQQATQGPYSRVDKSTRQDQQTSEAGRLSPDKGGNLPPPGAKAYLPPPRVGPGGANAENSSSRRQQPNNDPANGRTGLSAFLGDAEDLADACLEARDAMRVQRPARRLDSPGGQIPWSRLVDEGTIAEIDDADQQDEITTLADSAMFQRVAGCFYGMSRAEYAALLSSTGNAGRDSAVGGSIVHVVSDADTPDTIQRRYGVGWSQILRLNDLLPDEALLPGTKLQIPIQRPTGSPTAVDGLPVFGSHAGREAWGSDLYADLRVDADGVLILADDEDVLIQGIDWIVTQFSDELIQVLDQIPPVVQTQFMQERIAGYVGSDRRIVSVDSVAAEPAADGELRVSVQCTAINGATITTGSANA